ncbi:MAG: hypothetical protein J7527_07550 [Chitinophagaceae bacterium]|nr:hypothetical protein [Chitinophagaceae bacterium]
MKKNWSNEVLIDDFGQKFIFAISSEHYPQEHITNFEFEDIKRHFTVIITYYENDEISSYKFRIDPDKSLSDPHLSQLFHRFLEPIIDHNRHVWK